MVVAVELRLPGGRQHRRGDRPGRFQQERLCGHEYRRPDFRREAIDYFKTRATQFMGQAGFAVANLGIDGTPAYNDGVAVFTVTRFGLMGEFTISGVKFTYRPNPGGN